MAYQALAPTREAADKMLDARLAPRSRRRHDVLYQWDSARDYNAAPGLEKSARRCSP